MTELIGGAPASDAIIEAFSHHQHTRGLARKTIERRPSSLRGLARFASPVPLLEVTEDLIWDWLDTFEKAETRQGYQGDVRAFFRWARKRGLVRFDPTDDMATVKIPKHLPRMHEEDLNLALVTARDPRLRLVFMLGAYAGLRLSEIAALRADDCTRDLIVVRQGKGGKDGPIPTHSELWAMIQAHGVRRGYLFPSPDGGHVSSPPMGGWVRKHLNAIGLESVTLHQTRHRFGTRIAEAARANMFVVRDLMGHSGISVTEGYVAFDTSRLREYVDDLPVAQRDEVAEVRRRRRAGGE